MSTHDGETQPTKGQSLSTDINTATRSQHTQLNRLITSRLPLCLPPHAASPTIYATGLSHFAHVFLTFESLFHDIAARSSVSNPALSTLLEDPWVHVPTAVDPPSNARPPTPTNEHDEDIQSFLAALLPRGMPRSRRLLADLTYLTKKHPADLSASLARFPGDAVADFVLHIKETVACKPHVLVAYAWCFYMAVFSGGRWIRGQLTMVGCDFWLSTDPDSRSSTTDSQKPSFSALGLSFWNFDGDADGEDIKAAFKERLANADALITPDERADIIAEAQIIFGFCEDLVEELDDLLSTPDDAPTPVERVAEAYLPPMSPVTETPLKTEVKKRETIRDRLDVSNLVTATVVVGCVLWYAVHLLGASRVGAWLEYAL
ncbi:heme oxygenase-like protein [Pseudovirgaria hyperparasitica]|uniref:Heme oxygenase-like protein n=1 Tax=Pseudovirgaria hyperparasitica TaxID=470096 RepID=A0A6A6WBG0_9PEZI|nr:heme oxygenase-like protein [Pseudovirgaria hyperparasitica]KAF2759176.1 heme oxygenase-like protein [Pseudovirgaria hyperparasitica]